MELDWQQLVFETATLDKIERIADNRLFDSSMSLEAQNYVLEKLAEDDWRRCREFKGRSSPLTYIHVLASRLVEEFVRRKFGRPRPPAWVQQQGELWVNLWRQICLERKTPEIVIEQLVETTGRTAARLLETIRTIKARLPWCGESNMPQQVDIDDTPPPETGGPETARQALLQTELMLTLSSVLGEKADATAEASNEGIKAFWEAANLSDEELLLLKLLYGEQLPATTVARMMGMKPHQPGRLKQQVLARLRDAASHLDFDLDLDTSDAGGQS